MTINYSPFTKCMIFIGWLFLWFTVFPPLNSFLSSIDSAAKVQFIRKKLKFAAPIWIFHISKIQKRIVSAETICRNTVCIFDKRLDANKVFSQNDRPLVASSFMRVCSYAFHLKSIANHIYGGKLCEELTSCTGDSLVLRAILTSIRPSLPRAPLENSTIHITILFNSHKSGRMGAY